MTAPRHVPIKFQNYEYINNAFFQLQKLSLHMDLTATALQTLSVTFLMQQGPLEHRQLSIILM